MSKLSLFGGVFTALVMSVAAPVMTPLPAQNGPELSGVWVGTMRVDGTSTRVALTVLEHNSGYSAYVDTELPPSAVSGVSTSGQTIPVDRIEFVGSDVLFELSAIQGTYLVRPSDDGRLIAGMWRQDQAELPLILVRADRALERSADE